MYKVLSDYIIRCMRFQEKSELSLDFRGYRISYSERDKDFYIMNKEAVSHGVYVSHCEIEDIKNKNAKEAWFVIQEAKRIFDEQKEMGDDYALYIVNLLIRMWTQKSLRIRDFIATGNQYRVAQSAYKSIKEKTNV